MKNIFLLILIIIFATYCSQKHSVEQKIQAKPNIILLVADDAGYGDFGCYGQNIFQTPQVDRMAREGLLFTQAYAGSTVCAPSRSSLITGLHTGHTYIRGNREIQPEGQLPLPAQIETLPELMKEGGYVTGGFGKWGLGAPGTEGDPVNQGFDEWFGYNCQRLAHNYYPEYLWHNRDTVILHQNNNGKEGVYSHDLIHKMALDFIERHQDEPFFLFLPYMIPHAELLVPDDSLLRKYAGKFEETPYAGTDEGPDFRKGPYGSQVVPRAAFAAMMERLDLAVGDIINTLDELGISENTLFIFTSDNGPHLEGGADPDFFNSNGPFRGYKRDLYEGGIRVPFIARWPGVVPPDKRTDHLTAFWDLLPTFCEIAGVQINDSIDGISLLPLLSNTGKQKVHDYLYWEFYEHGGKQAIRKGPWKGVRLGVKENREAPVELYQLIDDPGETENVAGKHPEIANMVRHLMEEAHEPSKEFMW